MNESIAVDIAIVGGGLVGTPLAIMLARQGWSVALLEQQSSAEAVAGSRGFTALSDAAVINLNAWQLWEQASLDACAIRAVHVSHKGYFGSTRINCEQHAVDALGYVVDNATFLNTMLEPLQTSSVMRLTGAAVTRVTYQRMNANVQYISDAQEHSLQCKLVIAVDGVSSSLRDAAGIATKHTDYDQVGVLGTVQLEQDHQHVAYERFTPSGPLALLPRPDNTASFVYCIDPSMQDNIEAMDDTDFMHVLQSAFGHRLGRFHGVSNRVFVPLVRIEAASQVEQRLLLMGNAMRLLHPVAGQGYNLAIRDVEQLLQTLSDTNQDPGEATLLQSFAQSRESDHRQVVRMTDLLARTFRGHASMPAHVRALGLLGLDRLPLLRDRFTEHSMGHGR